MRTPAAFAFVACALLVGASCDGTSAPVDPAVARGKAAYLGTCIACHNINPALPGAVGPEVKGASKALIEARLLRAEYPAGYTPKRTTKIMPAQPQLAGSVDDIAAFLNAP